MKKLLSVLLVMVLSFTLLTPQPVSAAVKISKAKATMEKDSTLKLSISGIKTTITWKTNRKTIATVDKSGLITANGEGTATITATAGGKKYTCSVTVVDSNTIETDNNLTDLVKFMKSEDVLSGKETKMDASLIGGLSGVKYNNVELYEFDTNSEAYKMIVKTNKIYLKDFDMEFDISAINEKFIILSDDKDIVETFKRFK